MAKTPEELEKELAALQAKNAELEKNVENYKANAGGDEALKKRLEELEASNQKNSAENRALKVASARSAAIVKYPGAAPFLPAISSEDPVEIETKAKEFHEAATKQAEEAVKAKETEFAARWGQLPAGSPPGLMRTEEIAAKYEEAKKSNNPLGMITAIITRHLQAGKK